MMLVGAAAQAADLTGVARIIDGNTLAIGWTKLRLERINAPDTDQICLNAEGIRWNCGIEARDQLAAISRGKKSSARQAASMLTVERLPHVISPAKT